jgi:hypothetical protein
VAANAGAAYRDDQLAVACGPDGDLVAGLHASRAHRVDGQRHLVLRRDPRHALISKHHDT